MNVKMQLKLSYEPAALVWGDNALLSFGDNGATLHAIGDNPLISVQRAARKLDGQGLRKIELIGDAWTLETCWHVYLGLKSAKPVFDIQFPTLSLDEQKALNARIAATDWSCEIINQSAQEVGPKQLAVRAGEFIKSQAPNPEYVSYKIISAPDLLEEGWVGTYTVGRGSARKPTVLLLDFNPTGDNNAPVFACVVGKGITFDSGGYSLKPSNFMDAMKSDMGGAALATAGLGLAIAQGLNKRVKLILCCAENMVSNNAYKLGDIITYRNGKTVEVLNTDAEGRLVLADGLLYANECKPSLTVDCATLTGAAKMALGNDYHALFSFDQALAERVLHAAQHEGEGMWQLPLADFHRNMLPSSFADMANVCSGQYTPGASTAAAFLSHFVDNYKQGWLHLDCAATYRKTGSDLWSAGATGVGIRTLAKVLLDESKA